MSRNLLNQLWNDESGAVIATEYLMLGAIVAAGSAAGMAAMRDTVVDEYKEFGQTTREIRQSYSIPARQGGLSRTAGTNVTNNGVEHHALPPAPTTQELRFASPMP